MSQNNSNKPSSPSEIEFGDATMIGIANSDKTEVKVDPKVEPKTELKVAPKLEAHLEKTSPKIAPLKISTPPVRVSSPPEPAVMHDEATVVGGHTPPMRVVEALPVKAEPKPALSKPVEPRLVAANDSKSIVRALPASTNSTSPSQNTPPPSLANKSTSGTQTAVKAEVDLDRTIVEKVNPVKEAFDARTMVDSSQLKRFNADETQISPMPKADRQTPAAVTSAVTKSPNSEKTRSGEDSLAKFPEAPRFETTLVPDSNKKTQTRKTLLDDAPSMISRQSKEKNSASPDLPPDTFSPHHERAKAKANAQGQTQQQSPEIMDGELVEDLDRGDIPHQRKPSLLSTWIRKFQARREKSKPTEAEFENDLATAPAKGFADAPKNHRMRNAVIAGGAAVVLALVIMNISHSSDDAASANSPAAGKPAHSASASSEAPPAAVPPQANQGQGGGSVAAVIQQFDRAFAKTQDQR